jgi:secreted trypsin-like serine protease
MVSLQYDENHFCGASLINSRWVVTASHCHRPFTSDLSSVSAVVGTHSIESPDQVYSRRIAIEKFVMNEKFSRPQNGISNDIMLVKLAEPVTFNGAVMPVCLPEPFAKMPSGTTCWSTGWGTMESGAPRGSDVLNQVALPIIDNEVCNRDGWYDGEIDDTMVCAGYEEGGRDSCQGDSGGPFVCYENERWILYGIVSWGRGCAFPNKPGLYGRTSAYLKWIRKSIEADEAASS